MKKILSIIILGSALFAACNNEGDRNSVEKADSANQANLDTALNRNDIVIDEASSAFLVRTANAGMAEVQLTAVAEQKALSNEVKTLAAMLHSDHTAVNEQVKNLADQKNIVLPASLTEEKQTEISGLEKKTGKNFDREFLRAIIAAHEKSIKSFEDAMLDTKDTDVRSFADKTLPTLKHHLNAAKDLQKKV